MNTPTAETKGIFPTAVVLCMMALGAIMVAARLHGFSFSMWHSAIDGSPHSEVLLNTARSIRSDDWYVALPHSLSQRAHVPAFPAENRLIGDGHYNMRISGVAPVRDPITLFRPQTWGYFLSADRGMAFQWWFNALGLWLVTWLVLRRLTNNDPWLPACGATALLFSPFVQAWSLNCAPTIIFAGGVLLALARLWTATTKRDILSAAAFCVWCGAALLLSFNYLPYLVTLLYLVVFVAPGLIPALRSSRTLSDKTWLCWPCTVSALVAAVGLGIYFVAANWDTIAVIRNSDYPGHRLSPGGDQTIWPLFRGNILSIAPPANWGDSNACEGAGFFLFFPVIAIAMARDWWRTRKAPAAPALALLGYIVFLLIWNLVGFPEPLARWTLMNRAPTFRTLIGFGMADILLLAVYVAGSRQAPRARGTSLVFAFTVCLLWVLFHVALGLKAASYFPDYMFKTAMLGGAFSMGMGFLIFFAPRLVLPGLTIVSFLATADVNPVARGGTDFVYNNPLSQAIRALDQEARQNGRHPVWVAYGDLVLPNLFRMLGVRAINGVHTYPQLELWRTLDPAGQYREVFNRYAHVQFALPSAPDDFKIRLVQTDAVMVYLHPQNRRFASLKADYILCHDDQVEQLDQVPALKRIFSYAGKHIYGAERAIYRVNDPP